jgi:hypothetical protein
MDLNYKPKYLPQLSAPFSILATELKDRNVSYSVVDMNLDELLPTQGIIYSDKVNSILPNNIKPIFISNDNKILDGHHRYGSAIVNEIPKIKTIKIDLPFMDAIRVLNQIQDLYEYEIKVQDRLSEEKENNFLEKIQKDLEVVKKNNKNKTKITGFRKTPINDESKIGNFFILEELDNHQKYDIEFDNLLDTDTMNLTFKTSETPVKTLGNVWFPNVDFSSLAEIYGVEENLLLNRAVFEKAMSLGYDGIKYGDILLQGLN